MKIRKLIFAAAALGLMFASCEKSADKLSPDDINLADDDAVADVIFDDIFISADNALSLLDSFEKSYNGSKSGEVMIVADSCPLVSVTFIEGTGKIITVDYGDGCTGFYGQTRSGKIVITVDGRRRVEGSTHSVTFDNYFFNGIGVEGTRVSTNEGVNDNQNVVFSFSLTGGRLLFPDGKTAEREFYREREWVAGYDTFNPWDDEVLVTGYASGISISGDLYENSILTPLHRKRICPFPVSGVIEFTRGGMEPFTLDYGNGECDEYATVQRGDESREIVLKKKHRLLR